MGQSQDLADDLDDDPRGPPAALTGCAGPGTGARCREARAAWLAGDDRRIQSVEMALGLVLIVISIVEMVVVVRLVQANMPSA